MRTFARIAVALLAVVGAATTIRTVAGQAASPLARAPVTHVGVIVRDVDATVRRMEETFGIRIPAPFVSGKTVWNGDPSGPKEWRVKLTSFVLGGVTLELVEPLDEAGPHRAHLNQFGQGLHHIAFATPDRGAAFAWLTGKGGQQVSPTYVDMKELLGFTVEVAPTPAR